MFKPKDKINLDNGEKVEIIRLIGQGGQGEVYEVEKAGKRFALKWYLTTYLKGLSSSKDFYDNLSNNVLQGSPSQSFLWPLEITKKERGSFGYIMELREPKYIEFVHFLNAKVRFHNMHIMLIACKNITEAFRSLHSKGFSYQDINDANIFINKDTGEVKICDNDNVAPFNKSLGVAGKDRYMAPEVCLGKKKPNKNTDLYSMSIILFLLLFNAHPLEGQDVHKCPCLTQRYLKKFYAEDPVFVYDPNKNTNRPAKGIDDNLLFLWPLYPDKIKEMFIRAFTLGLKQEEYRIVESEWIEAFDNLSNDIAFCPKCKSENFISKNSESETIKCYCGKEFNKPMMLIAGRKQILLSEGKVVKASDIRITGDFDLFKVVGNKKAIGVLGLRNLSEQTWMITCSDGEKQVLKQNEVIKLTKDTEIDFGNIIGKIN